MGNTIEITQLIVFCIIGVAFIAALFLSWYFYHQARDKERMVLIERGDKLEDIIGVQKENKFEFTFPWLKVGVVLVGMSIAFLLIGFLVKSLENDMELFKGFLITFIIGACLGIACVVNHFIGKKGLDKHG
ncbi:hypothetical protein [Ekhidna sp.]